MARKTYARRYAQAVFEIALEKQKLDKWQSDLQAIAESMKNAELLAALQSPRVPGDVKEKLLSQLTGVDRLP